jgi:phosphopantetheinyl transferase
MLWLDRPIRAETLPCVWLIATGAAPRTRPERSALRHGVSREVIALQAGAPASEIDIVNEPSGRPVIRAKTLAGLHLSHATRGGVVAVGLARTRIGVDIEAVGAGPIPAQALHRAEQLWLAQLAPARRAASFAQLWAAKEAYGKWAGTGLPETDAIALLPDGDGAWRVTGAASAAITTRLVEIGGQPFAAAVATNGG